MTKSRWSPTAWVITSTHQMKCVSFRKSELCFWFLLCITAPIAACVLHCSAVGETEGVSPLLFLTSWLKTELCPNQVSESCIFSPSGDKSSVYESKIWLPYNSLQSELRRREKSSLGSQINQDEKNWQEKRVCYSVKWSGHQAWCPEPSSDDTQYTRQKKKSIFITVWVNCTRFVLQQQGHSQYQL